MSRVIDDLLAHRGVGGVARLDDEAHPRPLRAADHVDDLAKLHPDDLDGLLRRPWATAMILSFGLSWRPRSAGPPGTISLTAHDVVLEAEHRADPDKLELHLDAEVLAGVGGQVGRVGVVQPGDRGEEHLGTGRCPRSRRRSSACARSACARPPWPARRSSC